jgi:hypothetical protein
MHAPAAHSTSVPAAAAAAAAAAPGYNYLPSWDYSAVAEGMCNRNGKYKVLKVRHTTSSLLDIPSTYIPSSETCKLRAFGKTLSVGSCRTEKVE